jgi:hypothetical protein
MNKAVHMHGDFRFKYTSKPGGKPLTNSRFLLTTSYIRTEGGGGGGGRNKPAKILIFSFFSPSVKTWTFRYPFSVITESGLLFICMPLSSKVNMCHKSYF